MSSTSKAIPIGDGMVRPTQVQQLLPLVPRLASTGAWLACSALYVAVAAVLIRAVLANLNVPGRAALFAIGLLGGWRLSWFLVNVTRAALNVNWRFPKFRRAADALGPTGRASEVIVLITSYRIKPEVTVPVFQALFDEAAAYGVPVTVMASMGNAEEQDLVRTLFEGRGAPSSVRLELFLQSGAGKREAMADVLAAIQRRPLPDGAVVAFLDGDTLLKPGTFERSFSFFRLRPEVGALTTDERAIVSGTSLAREWFDLRFAQRHLYMSSVGLSDKVLTLTGRFCAFRAEIATHPDFLRIVREDHIDHWRLGRIQFLTGDDKSTWYWVLRAGWSMLYVPDVCAYTFESMPSKGFVMPSVQLMCRWYGNMLRTNGRALALGPRRVGPFAWWSLLEQRISTWTSLVGPTFGLLMLTGKIPGMLAAYLLWTLGIKSAQSVLLGAPRGRVSPFYPFLLYYNQVVGAVVKIHMTFNLHKQRWTRQGTGQTQVARDLREWVVSSGLTALSYAMFVVLTAAVALHDPRAEEATTQGQIERMLAEAKPGSVVRVAAREIRLTKPLIIRRDDVVLEGAGRGKTTLVASFSSSGLPTPAMVVVRGELPSEVQGDRKGQLESPLDPTRTTVNLTHPIKVQAGDFVALRTANDQAFLDALGARRWNQRYPILRQTLGRVTRAEGSTITLERPVGDTFPAGTEVIPVHLRREVTIRDLTMRYELNGEPAPDLYENTRPNKAVDGIMLLGTADVNLENVEIFSAGRHPLSIDTAYAPRVSDALLEGAWNKGPGGNGYVRIARTSFGTFDELTLRGLRHLTIQWSSHDNTFDDLDADCDVNFHGGWSRRNRVHVARLAPRPNHPWPKIMRTPATARWAPPDGLGNVVFSPFGAELAEGTEDGLISDEGDSPSLEVGNL
ncbi:glycosyltransferase [Sorangium sp. So ce887]|uniref:glycosyltransferase n=1 Tax=Sorangium sp. So ce887 TaxID=3133324 RepID=UPI003F61D4D9